MSVYCGVHDTSVRDSGAARPRDDGVRVVHANFNGV